MFSPADVVVLGLSGAGLGGENAETVSAFRDQTGVSFPLLLGDESRAAYGNVDGAISPYPLDVIVDRQGVVRYLAHRFDGAAMVGVVEHLLAEP